MKLGMILSYHYSDIVSNVIGLFILLMSNDCFILEIPQHLHLKMNLLFHVVTVLGY